MAAPVTLPVHCAHCGGKVTLQMSDWPAMVHHGTLAPFEPVQEYRQTWGCPYCHNQNEGGFPGRMAWVTKGHEPEPTA